MAVATSPLLSEPPAADSGEFLPYYAGYVARVPAGDLLATLEAQLAETVAVLAGASPLRWRQVIPAAALGALPSAFLYAWAGATARGLGMAWVALAVAATAAVLWLVGRRLERRSPDEASGVRR